MVVDHIPRNDERSEALPVINGMIASSPIIERELIGTLCARDYKGVGNQYVQEGKCIPVQPPIAFKVRGGGEYTGTKGGEVRPNERNGTGMLAYEDKTFTIASTQDQFVATPILPIPINTMAALRDQSAEQNRQTFGVGQPGDTMYTITKAHHHAVGVQQQLLYENHAQDSRVTGPHDLSPTVAAKFGTGGGNVPLVQAADPVTFQPGNLRLDAGADPSTVATTTLKASMGDQMPHIATPMAVRRLLPEECEALQGFPRNHTRISWRGKSPEQCPDGPRYKAIGNSMATNCMKWIGKRIQLVDNYLRENNIDTK
jgi:site-specific DNA-cytosine methylase